jgi:tetratricopeptide (TPR) repeat protein
MRLVSSAAILIAGLSVSPTLAVSETLRGSVRVDCSGRELNYLAGRYVASATPVILQQGQRDYRVSVQTDQGSWSGLLSLPPSGRASLLISGGQASGTLQQSSTAPGMIYFNGSVRIAGPEPRTVSCAAQISAPISNIAQWANEGASAALTARTPAPGLSPQPRLAGKNTPKEMPETTDKAGSSTSRLASDQAGKQEREERMRAEEKARQAAAQIAREREARLKAEADLQQLKDELASTAREIARAEIQKMMQEREGQAIADQSSPIASPVSAPTNPAPRGQVNTKLNAVVADGKAETAADAESKAQEALTRGMALGQRGDHDAAIAEFTTAIRLNPKDPSAYLERATALTFKQEDERALADLNEALGLDPKNARARNNRGIQYQEKGDLDRAIADFSEAIQADPGFTRAYYNRGAALVTKGDLDAAIRDFDAALRIDPTVAGGYVDRGNAYLQKGDHKRAVADFDVAIRLDPEDVDAYNGRAYAYAAQGDLDRAIADFSTVVQKAPDAWIAFMNRGNLYLQTNKVDLAIKDLNEAARLNPHEPSVFLNRGMAFKKKDELARAIADYSEAVRLNPKDAVAYSNRGIAYHEKGDYRQALADFEAALRLDPASKIAKEGRATAKLEQVKAVAREQIAAEAKARAERDTTEARIKADEKAAAEAKKLEEIYARLGPYQEPSAARRSLQAEVPDAVAVTKLVPSEARTTREQELSEIQIDDYVELCRKGDFNKQCKGKKVVWTAYVTGSFNRGTKTMRMSPTPKYAGYGFDVTFHEDLSDRELFQNGTGAYVKFSGTLKQGNVFNDDIVDARLIEVLKSPSLVVSEKTRLDAQENAESERLISSCKPLLRAFLFNGDASKESTFESDMVVRKNSSGHYVIGTYVNLIEMARTENLYGNAMVNAPYSIRKKYHYSAGCVVQPDGGLRPFKQKTIDGYYPI